MADEAPKRKQPSVMSARCARRGVGTSAIVTRNLPHPAVPEKIVIGAHGRCTPLYDGVQMISVLAICIGASLGALARWGLGLWLNPGALIPWGTLAANLIGGYLVGVCVAIFQLLPNLDPVWRLALVTGFLGALTTFSSFSAEVIGLLSQQRYLLGGATAAVHLFGSLALTIVGIRSAMFFIATK
jgi:fluoride exporter